MILPLMKTLYAHDVICVFAVVIFWKEICSKSKLRYPVKLFDKWIPQTATCQKLEAKFLRNMKSNIESTYCIETGKR